MILILGIVYSRAPVVNGFQRKINIFSLPQWGATIPKNTAASNAVLWRCYRLIRNFRKDAIACCLKSASAVSFVEGSPKKQQLRREEPVMIGLAFASGSKTCSIFDPHLGYRQLHAATDSYRIPAQLAATATAVSC